MEVTKHIENGSAVDVMYMAFCEAFDKVPFWRVIQRFRGRGSQESRTIWQIGSIIDGNRKQRAVAEGVFCHYDAGDWWCCPVISVVCEKHE